MCSLLGDGSSVCIMPCTLGPHHLGSGHFGIQFEQIYTGELDQKIGSDSNMSHPMYGGGYLQDC